MRKFISAFSASLFLFLISVQQVQAQVKLRNWDDPDGDPATADSCLVDSVPTLKCLEVVIANVMIISNALILLALFIMLVIGSFQWLTSLGEPDKVSKAQGTFKWAVIGLVVYVSSYLILRIIDILLLGGQGNLFKFSIGG